MDISYVNYNNILFNIIYYYNIHNASDFSKK